jgi:hypothetical protein
MGKRFSRIFRSHTKTKKCDLAYTEGILGKRGLCNRQTLAHTAALLTSCVIMPSDYVSLSLAHTGG